MVFEIQLYYGHLFCLLVTVGFYAFPNGRLAGRWSAVSAFFALAASVSVRAFGAGRIPLATMYEFGLFLSLILTSFILVVDFKFKSRLLALLITCASFVLAAVQLLFFQESHSLTPALKSAWLTAHVLTAVAAYGLLSVSFVLAVAGLCWKQAPDSIERFVNRLVAAAFPLLTLLLITGAVWAEYAWGSFWSWDPKETWALVTWLVYLGYLHLVRTRGWKGRKVLWLAVFGYVVVLFTFYGVNLLLAGLHSYA